MTAQVMSIDEEVAYVALLRAAVEGTSDDDALLGALDALPGGRAQALEVVATGMPRAFRPEYAAGERGIIELRIGLDAAHPETWTVLRLGISPEGCVRHTDATGPAPDTTMVLSLPTLLRLAFRIATGADAYMDGLVIVTGDVVLAANFSEWFEEPGVTVQDEVAS